MCNETIPTQLYAAASGPANAGVVNRLNASLQGLTSSQALLIFHSACAHPARFDPFVYSVLRFFLTQALVSVLQSLNQTFYAAWQPDQPDFQDLLSVNQQDIFSQFNTSLAYNPFIQVQRRSEVIAVVPDLPS